MALTRIGGMTFKGIHITNMDFNLNTYKLISVDIPLTPTMTYREFSAPKRHGSKRYDNRYENKTITVTIGVTGTAIERQEKITSLLEQWIDVEDKLMFDNRPGLFYKAKFFDEIEQKDTGTFTEFTIIFNASYVMYELYDDLRDYTVDQLTMAVDDIGILVNRAEWPNITASQTKQINNLGNYEAQPIFDISGTAILLLLTIGEKAFSLENINGTVWVDTENMIVYSVSGSTKTSKMQQFKGLFPTIAKGLNYVEIGGTTLNLAITVDFKNTYIV